MYSLVAVDIVYLIVHVHIPYFYIQISFVII